MHEYFLLLGITCIILLLKYYISGSKGTSCVIISIYLISESLLIICLLPKVTFEILCSGIEIICMSNNVY